MDYLTAEDLKIWITALSALLGVFLTGLIAIFSWYKVHQLTAKRDLDNSKRAARVKELSESYKALVRCAIKGLHKVDDGKIDRTIADEVENAILTIHLYGSAEQSRLASKYSREMADKNSADFTELVECLRKDIRTQLGEVEIIEEPAYFRYFVEMNDQ